MPKILPITKFSESLLGKFIKFYGPTQNPESRFRFFLKGRGFGRIFGRVIIISGSIGFILTRVGVLPIILRKGYPGDGRANYYLSFLLSKPLNLLGGQTQLAVGTGRTDF